jgi:hypothetical protein
MSGYGHPKFHGTDSRWWSRRPTFQHIPDILTSEASTFAERAAEARRIWESRFGPDALADTVSQWGFDLVNNAQQVRHAPRHIADLLRQTVSWRFIRRGVVSELRRVLLRSGA